MTADNAEQIEYWSGRVGQRWADLHERTDLLMTNITDAVMAFAAPCKGERVLDVGCGCGSTTLRLGMAVAPSGSVAGVDVSVPMLAIARARAEAMNADIVFLEDDAAMHDFQPVFDLAFSRFGVMFFADPAAAFANIRRSLAPGGRVVFVCWRPFAENAWSYAPFEAALPFLPPQPQSDPHAPGPFAFADKDRVEGILHTAGFASVVIEPFDGPANLGTTVDEATEQVMLIGPVSRAVSELTSEQRTKVREAIKPVLAKSQTASGVTPAAACWLVRATV